MHVYGGIFSYLSFYAGVSKEVSYLSISEFYYNHNIHYKRKISKTFRLSKPISCQRNKELAVCTARRILVYAVRIIKGYACKKGQKKKGRREVKRDLKPTSTSYSSEGVTTEIGI